MRSRRTVKGKYHCNWGPALCISFYIDYLLSVKCTVQQPRASMPCELSDLSREASVFRNWVPNYRQETNKKQKTKNKKRSY